MAGRSSAPPNGPNDGCLDPEFHTIDALVVVDLLAAPEHLQQRYLGTAGAAALRQQWHADPATSA
ncbi:MAG: hypothetical protein JNL08_11775 [Planctomycetes bacterium]|nr:hypothetical protein [Planctomycetota bacterium]